MPRTLPAIVTVSAFLACLAGGCARNDRSANTAPRPALANDDAPVTEPRPPIEYTNTGNAIDTTILLVNRHELTVAEVLYGLRKQLDALRESNRNDFLRGAAELLRARVPQEIGSILVYEKALAQLTEQQQTLLDAFVDKQIDKEIAMAFDDVPAKFEQHLETYGLSPSQYKAVVRRRMLVSDFTRERLIPKVDVTRQELLAAYRARSADYSTPETRELLMIEAPFEAFLPRRRRWQSSSDAVRDKARSAARAHIDEAHAALRSQPFADVARERCRGVQQTNGGSWGMIGRPLQPPYERATRQIFTFRDGQYSAPIETSQGWIIVACGEIQAAEQESFATVQAGLRESLVEQRYNQLASEYLSRLSESATVSAVEPFMQSAYRRLSALYDDSSPRLGLR